MEKMPSPKKMNLIPVEMAVPAKAIKVAVVVNKISTVLLIFFILILLGLGGLIFYFSNQNGNINSSIASLKLKIQELQTSEQKLVLAKDRLAKISIVQKAKSVDDEITRFKKFSDLMILNPESSISEANLNSKGTEVSIVSASSSALSSILKPLSNLKDYKRIIMTSLAYNSGTGFLSTISLENE